MITVYRKNVDFIDSFVFELWLLNNTNHTEYEPVRIKEIAEKTMEYYAKKFTFESILKWFAKKN